MRGYSGDPDFLPTGYVAKTQVPTFIVGFDSGGGAGWSAGGNGCKERAIEADKLYREGTKIDATVEIDTLTASPPAVSRPVN